MPLILIRGRGAMAIGCAVVVNVDGGVGSDNGSDGDYCRSVMKMLLLLLMMLLLYLLFIPVIVSS